ncbi:DUF4900 domain-containing protein [bacterium]|nr:DUF4900 domain-containing protein [bacterium]
MEPLKVNVFRRDRNGGILFNTMILVMLMVFTSVAFLQWAADEHMQTDLELARAKAYYVAYYGAIQEGLKYMRTRNASNYNLETVFAEQEVFNPDGKPIGRYSNVRIREVAYKGEEQGANDFFTSSRQFDLFSTGSVPLNKQYPDGMLRRNPFPDKVSRTVRLRAKLRTFANYMYLTNNEVTRFNEIIWFWSPDVLWGRVHSNDAIGLKFNPTFYGPVSSTADHFVEYSANPYFAYEPELNAPRVGFPDFASELRSGAGMQGNFISDNEGQLWTRMECGDGGIEFKQWTAGTPWDSTQVINSGSIGYGSNRAVFVEGELFLWGDFVSGTITIGSEGNMNLMDNIKYAEINEASPQNPSQDFSDFPHLLGLVSESNIRIQNTWANGRENGASTNNPDRESIVITAAMVALGESFTFRDQNDTWNTYRFCPGPDERGEIHLRGAVTQERRGYVHRSNCRGTGYDKDYEYDFRLDYMVPPFYLEATDEQGNSLFDIVELEELPPDKNPENLP